MVTDGRPYVTGIPATVDENMVPLPDDALVINENGRASLDKDLGLVAMPASLIDVPTYNWKSHFSL
jgi:hypothetical protein